MPTSRVWELPTDYNRLQPAEKRELRIQYIAQQAGLCIHCNEPLDGAPAGEVQVAWVDRSLFPKNFFNHPIHLHHNHDTGLTIGAVHAQCNAVLWQYHGE